MKRQRIAKPKRRSTLGRSDVTAPPQFPMRDRRARRPVDALREQIQHELDEIDELLGEDA